MPWAPGWLLPSPIPVTVLLSPRAGRASVTTSLRLKLGYSKAVKSPVNSNQSKKRKQRQSPKAVWCHPSLPKASDCSLGTGLPASPLASRPFPSSLCGNLLREQMNLRPVPPSLHSSSAASKTEEDTLAPFSYPVNPMFKHYLSPSLSAVAQILELSSAPGSTQAPGLLLHWRQDRKVDAGHLCSASSPGCSPLHVVVHSHG